MLTPVLKSEKSRESYEEFMPPVKAKIKFGDKLQAEGTVLNFNSLAAYNVPPV